MQALNNTSIIWWYKCLFTKRPWRHTGRQHDVVSVCHWRHSPGTCSLPNGLKQQIAGTRDLVGISLVRICVLYISIWVRCKLIFIDIQTRLAKGECHYLGVSSSISRYGGIRDTLWVPCIPWCPLFVVPSGPWQIKGRSSSTFYTAHTQTYTHIMFNHLKTCEYYFCGKIKCSTEEWRPFCGNYHRYANRPLDLQRCAVNRVSFR